MNKSQRIYFSSGETGNESQDKYLKVKLEQNIESIEFLSISLGTEDVYQNFNADYGVLIGRVLANDSIGIPNARISIFIPLTDEDAENSDIYSIYPYKTPRDKNNEGKRYNLLPRVSKKDPITGLITPKQPFGSFPIREEIIGNEPFLNVYKKYYKYTALTNNSGDYMIFGVPVGTQTIHLSVDITDIGKYSMSPAAMVTNLGYSPNLFTDGGNKIKESNDLNDLPNIETQEISVDIRPFWGDVENFEIGITRQDFRVRSVLKNTFTIFGSVFTDLDGQNWGRTEDPDKNRPQLLYLHSHFQEGTGIKSKRVGKVTEKIYYYPASITDEEIETGTFVDEMLLLDPSEYSIYKNNGDFVLIINCNRTKVKINDDGTETPVDNSFAGGLYTEFRGFMTLEITPDDLNLDWQNHGDHLYMKPIRQKYKFPQTANFDWGAKKFYSFQKEVDTASTHYSNAWRQQHYKFCGGKIYSVAKFHGLVFNDDDDKQDVHHGWFQSDHINFGCHGSTSYNAGIIQTNDYGYTGNTHFQMPSNITNSDGRQLFGANWMNISIYLPQTAWVFDNYSYNEDNPRSNAQVTVNVRDSYYFNDNQQQIAGSYVNTSSFARSDYNWTDFIEVPKEDIIAMQNVSKKGFKASSCCIIQTTTGSHILKGTYRNGCFLPTGTAVSWTAASPSGGGRCNGYCGCATRDCKTYFYKGFDSSDAINYIVDLGIV